jgi:hypothetical protein
MGVPTNDGNQKIVFFKEGNDEKPVGTIGYPSLLAGKG